jgi:hypothetical protein
MRNDRNQLNQSDYENKKEVTITYWIQTPVGWFSAGEKESAFRLLKSELRAKYSITSCEKRKVTTQGSMYLGVEILAADVG